MSCVLTLALNDEALERFEQLRQEYFPPELNRVPAHLSLFHTLPDDPRTQEHLSAIASATACFPMRVDAVKSIGRGVSYFLSSPEAVRLHGVLRQSFEADLTMQDRQGFRPHVVVQNKTTPERARETLALLQAGFQPWACQATGLDLWRYLGGPWQHLERFSFTA